MVCSPGPRRTRTSFVLATSQRHVLPRHPNSDLRAMFLSMGANGGVPLCSFPRRAGLRIFVIKFERSKMQGKAPKACWMGRQHPLEKALPAAVPSAEVDPPGN